MSSRPFSARIQSRKNGSPMAPADSALRSMPDEKARPSPVTTTTQASGSVSAAATASASSAASCASRAFSTSGRVRVIHPTPSTASYRTCAPRSFTGPTLPSASGRVKRRARTASRCAASAPVPPFRGVSSARGLVREFYAARARRDLAGIRGLIAPDVVWHEAAVARRTPGT